MAKIRDLFHDVGNLHNKISIGAGLIKMELQERFRDKTPPSQIKRMLAKLDLLERAVVEASGKLNQLKNIIYRITDPDREIISGR